MRDLINMLSEASRIDPSPTALKFWITDKGEIKMIGETHHFDYIMASGMTWGEVFDKGWVRGFFEQKTNLICFEFDQRNITRGSRRSMLKLTKDFDVFTVMWDDNRHGAHYGSERLSVDEFGEALRHLLTEDYEEGELYWFWFNAATNHVHHIEDGTHTLAAQEDLDIPGMEDIDHGDDLEDADTLELAIRNNWVRGRYDNNQLTLQGLRRNVQRCAKWVAEHYPVDVLYVDLIEDTFRADLDKKTSTALRGDRLEYFLKRGWIPTAMVAEDTLEEMPISNINHLGNWDKNSSFRHVQDRKLLTNPKAVTKIKSMWKYPDYVNYNIILINNAEANQWTEEGLVGFEKLKSMFPKTHSEIAPLLKDDEVNIIFTNNKGAARVPMTGWVMAHRLGHALFRGGKNYYFKESVDVIERYLKELMDDYGIRPNAPSYDRSTPSLGSTTSRNIAHAICTFKSAREKKLRTSFEMVHELFAQYVINGTVKFNPPPRSIKVGNSTYPFRYDEESYQRTIHAVVDDMPYEVNPYFDAAINSVVGKVLVM